MGGRLRSLPRIYRSIDLLLTSIRASSTASSTQLYSACPAIQCLRDFHQSSSFDKVSINSVLGTPSAAKSLETDRTVCNIILFSGPVSSVFSAKRQIVRIRQVNTKLFVRLSSALGQQRTINVDQHGTGGEELSEKDYHRFSDLTLGELLAKLEALIEETPDLADSDLEYQQARFNFIFVKRKVS